MIVIIVQTRPVTRRTRRVGFKKMGMNDRRMARSVARMNVFKRSHGKREQQRKTCRQRCQQTYPICGGLDQTFTIFTLLWLHLSASLARVTVSDFRCGSRIPCNAEAVGLISLPIRDEPSHGEHSGP